MEQLGCPQGGQGRLLRWLDDDAVSGSERGADFSGSKHWGMIERSNADYNAVWFAHGEIERIGTHRDRDTLHLGDEPREELEVGDGDIDVAFQFADRVAAVDRVEQSELIGVSAQNRCKFLEQARSLERNDVAPNLEPGLAAATIASTSSTPASAIVASFSPVAGLKSSEVCPEIGTCHWPPK